MGTDTAPAMATDSNTAQASDTALPSRPGSTAARVDTTPTVASKPAQPRPSTRKPTRPKPPVRRPSSDSASSDTGATAARPDTSTTAAPSSDSSAAGQTSEASAPLRDPYHQAPLDTVPQQVYDGWKQFNLNCARCHGEDAQGTTIAPHLIVSLKPDGPINTKEIFMQTVCAGRPAKGMPSWCALGMEMSTIEAIYSYVKGRSDAKIHPGRPAVKSGG